MENLTNSEMYKKNIKVSVIIPTYNGGETIKDCVNSIQKQTFKPFETLIIDNASDSKTLKELVKLSCDKSIRYFRNDKNLGVTGGRNRGIKEANKKSDYLLFFDHDMVADKDMLRELLNIAESANNIGIVTPKIYYWETNSSLKQYRKRIWAAGTNINLITGQVLFRGGRDTGQFESAEAVQVAPAALLVKKAVITKVAEFDNRYFATYEDTDFCFRAKDAGFKTYYAPKAIAFHKISEDRKDEAKRLLSRSYWVGRNRILFMLDFGKCVPVFLLFSPIYLVYFAKLAFQEKDFGGLRNYFKGYLCGLKEILN